MKNDLKRAGQLKSQGLMQAVILFLFCFPLFFQLSGTIFTATDAVYDSQGSLLRIPLPIASVVCFIGIAMSLRLGNSYFGTGFVFSFFVLMVLSAIVSTSRSGEAVILAKFIHLVQFVLPSFALILGCLYKKPVSDYLRVEAILLYMLMIIIPLEVIATINSGNVLSARLFFFSLYQHFQYLPVVFCGFYFLAVTAFYQTAYLRLLVVILAPFMGAYIAQSISVSTMLLAIYGSVIMSWLLYRKGAIRFAIFLIVLASAAYLVQASQVRNTKAYDAKFGQIHQIEALGVAGEASHTEIGDRNVTDNDFLERISQSLPKNLRHRLSYWRFYIPEIIESPKLLLFGHASRPDRNKYPSAHNYYLDLVYNFGLIALLPFLYLLVVSIRGSWQAVKADNVSSDLTMLVALVAFYVGIDNFFKVGFSQPYPGMMMFFLWGLLLIRIQVLTNADKNGLA